MKRSKKVLAKRLVRKAAKVTGYLAVTAGISLAVYYSQPDRNVVTEVQSGIAVKAAGYTEGTEECKVSLASDFECSATNGIYKVGGEYQRMPDAAVIVDDYFRLYSEPTAIGAIKSQVSIGDLRDGAGLGTNEWAAFAGYTKGLSNVNCVKEGINVAAEDIDEYNQLYHGRYMVAVGPSVMNPNRHYTDEVFASEMGYGSYVDVVLEDNKGALYYLPCVVMDCKPYTYPNGYYQTNKAIVQGKIKMVESECDNSSVTFLTSQYSENGDVKCSIGRDYNIKDVIVYSEGTVNVTD